MKAKAGCVAGCNAGCGAGCGAACGAGCGASSSISKRKLQNDPIVVDWRITGTLLSGTTVMVGDTVVFELRGTHNVAFHPSDTYNVTNDA